MSAPAQIDYDQLAQQHGGSAAVDYDALAAQHGGAAVSAPDNRSLWQRFKDNINTAATEPISDTLDSYAHATEFGAKHVRQGVAQALEGAGHAIMHPIDTAQAVGLIPSSASPSEEGANVISKLQGFKQGAKDAMPKNLLDLAGKSGNLGGQILTGTALSELGGATIKGAGAVGEKISAALPGARMDAAGELFQKVTAKVGNNPVNIEAPGSVALRIKELADRGGSMPMVVRKFLNRVTAPDAPPMTYSEARDFYSNATRLSADETMRLTPKLKFEVGRFTSELGKEIFKTAAQGGAGAEHAQAMLEYAKAAKQAGIARDVLDTVKTQAVKGALGAAGAGGAYGIYRALNKNQ